jgi:hypothetical protein
MRKFSLKACTRWEVREYKGRRRVIMNQNPMDYSKKIDPYNVLSPTKVRDFIAWLQRYLDEIDPTDESIERAAIRAQARGIERSVNKLDATAKTSIAKAEGK